MHKLLSTILRLLPAIVTAVALSVTSSAEATEQIIYTFTGMADGGSPQTGLVVDSKGNLYGTTFQGGANFEGTVFELTPSANGTWTEQVIHNFAGFSGTLDGAFPYGTLVFDAKGNLYGTTDSGGASFQGTVFELSPQSDGTWTEKVLYSFGGLNGASPFAGVILDGAGNVYGTTYSGGSYGFGIVYELVPGANGTWTEKVLHNFTGGIDGAYSFFGSLAFDSGGNLYGETYTGGAHDYGVVYQLSPGANGVWTEKVIHAFSGGSDGSSSTGSVAIDKDNHIFAESTFTVLELIPASDGTWTPKTIHNFLGGSDGASPEGGLILDKSGDLYGVTYNGGLHRGTVFELLRGAGGLWTEQILHKFTSGNDGNFPEFAPLVLDPSGNVYGTTPTGGSFNTGIVFEVKP